MERAEILRWLRDHPQTSHVDPEDVVAHCERAVRRHADEDAWLAARRYLERRRRGFASRVGAYASEAFVAREVCHQLAGELRRHEPDVGPADAEHLAGGPIREAVDADGWEVLVQWVLDIARDQEHRTWQEIVRYTDRRARELIREHHLSEDSSLDHSRCYDEVAERVTGLLEHDCAVHAFPR